MKGWKAGAFRDEGLYFLMEIIFTLLFKTLWDLYSFILLLSTKIVFIERKTNCIRQMIMQTKSGDLKGHVFIFQTRSDFNFTYPSKATAFISKRQL
jgi:hypothetical protein